MFCDTTPVHAAKRTRTIEFTLEYSKKELITHVTSHGVVLVGHGVVHRSPCRLVYRDPSATQTLGLRRGNPGERFARPEFQPCQTRAAQSGMGGCDRPE